jgi:hypothetical protein
VLTAGTSKQDCIELVPGTDKRPAHTATAGKAIGFQAHIKSRCVLFFCPENTLTDARGLIYSDFPRKNDKLHQLAKSKRYRGVLLGV